MPNLFAYINYRTYLNDIYQEKKAANSRFSYRVFSRLAGFASPNFIKLVMLGERNLSADAVLGISKALAHSDREASFFLTLVLFNQCQSPQEKKKYFDELVFFKEFQAIKEIDKQYYEYLSKWYYAVVRELTLLPHFQESPEWISKRLKGQITKEEAKEALALLKRLKLVVHNKNRRLVPANKNISTPAEILDWSVSNFHREMVKLAEKAIDDVLPEHRDISSVTVAVDQETFQLAKQKIQNFRRELNVLLSACKKPTGVVQLNFQIFSLTEVPWKKT